MAPSRWVVLASVSALVAALFAALPGAVPARANAGGPTWTDGGITFGPGTVVDLQRTGGEPLNWIDEDGHVFVSAPLGTHTQQSWINRSTDGGDSFQLISPINLRPNAPPGGGDVDVATDDQGVYYFTDLEALVDLDASVSNDQGNTWRKNPLSVLPGDDRQYFAIDNGVNHSNGPLGAADNTVFLAVNEQGVGLRVFSSPGSTGPSDPIGGLVFQNAATSLTGLAPGAFCGQTRFDPVKRMFYYPCGAGTSGRQVRIVRAHVPVGQRTGLVFSTILAPAAPVPIGANDNIILFPGVGTDAAGNLYAVWTEFQTRNVWYSYTSNPEAATPTWSTPVRVNGNDAVATVMPWVQGGAPGKVAISFYGSPQDVGPDDRTSWFVDRVGSTASKWYTYAALIEDANTASPTIHQAKISPRPMHYGQICTAGTICLAELGDRVLLEYNAIFLDPDTGAMHIIYNETSSQHHGPHLYAVRQLTGPTAFGTTLAEPAPANPMADQTGDALNPHYSPTGPGPNTPRLDLTNLAVSRPDDNTLHVEMTVANLSGTATPVGKTRAIWLTRFQAKSKGEGGEEAYRIFHVGAESLAGGALTFFAGSGISNTGEAGEVPGNGCLNTLPGAAAGCKIVTYPSEIVATGSVTGNTIKIDVPLSAFGANRPIDDTILHNVSAFTQGRNADSDVYSGVDATNPFDFDLEGGVGDCTLLGTEGPDILKGTAGDDVICALGGNDAAYGFGGNDLILGAAGNDVLVGGPGADSLFGDLGNDTLQPGTGNDPVVEGGAGLDGVTYPDATAAVQVDLGAGTATGGGGTDGLFAIENASGSNFNDGLTGSGAANQLDGRGGTDTVDGAGGNDTLIGGPGTDALDGGAGTDTGRYFGSPNGATVDLSAGTATNDGFGTADTLTAVEYLHGSNTAGDTLTGSNGPNQLFGFGGSDSLFGLAGNDRLHGGEGADSCNGGGQAGDTFVSCES